MSRYGLQDVYGNVAEWVKDDFQWSGTDFIQSNTADLLFDADGGGVANDRYRFDYLIGPCNDYDTSGSCTWPIQCQLPNGIFLKDFRSYYFCLSSRTSFFRKIFDHSAL